ncbi:flagellar motor switch protein FliN [Chitinispirillales bacterium ANBcel5]|uniref:flagellar motor switch protein FliN n=1 Tax=Cellulosispirillum alkaliphilum TaxID=3039283 RepID=UPI002A500B9F|nr:flagellar motor switch protein FliN [Chitinispirillales bacterium ANBcel5]
MSDYLSQDQIDSLLSGAINEDESEESSSQDSSVEHYAALATMFDLFCEQAGSVVSTVLNKTFEITAEMCQKADFSTIQEKMKAVVVSLSLSFRSGITGDMYLIMHKKDVAMLSDLMMMGDGSADYNEDHKDAIGELFNQVMGAFSTALGEQISQSVSCGSVEVTEFDLEDPPFPPDSLDMAVAKVKIEEMLDSYVALLIPEEIATQLSTKLPSVDSSEENDNVGLNMAELDELSNVASNFNDTNGAVDQFRESAVSGAAVEGRENIELLLDVELDVSIELGRSSMSIKRILDLAPGAVVELERMAGEPVDLLVNDKVVARGEVVVVDENFGIRIVSLVSAEDRIKSLR